VLRAIHETATVAETLPNGCHRPTLTHYSHVLPGHQADAAALVAMAVLGEFR
jgi:hypothetical protein